jgi:hypothetical protein
VPAAMHYGQSVAKRPRAAYVIRVRDLPALGIRSEERFQDIAEIGREARAMSRGPVDAIRRC